MKKTQLDDMFEHHRKAGISLNNERSINKIAENTEDIHAIAHMLSRICGLFYVIIILLIMGLMA